MQPEDIGWYHSIDLGGGVITCGANTNETLKHIADRVFAPSVEGKSVLDIGAWDGFFSFEAERRGAKGVLATDHFCWSAKGPQGRAGFDFARARLSSQVKDLDVDVLSLSPEKLGRFDVVLFLGVLYHTEDMLTYLRRAAAMTSELLVIETETRLNFLPFPAARYFPSGELNNDPTNFWAPNLAWLRAALGELGFARIEIKPTLPARKHRRFMVRRHLVHAWRR